MDAPLAVRPVAPLARSVYLYLTGVLIQLVLHVSLRHHRQIVGGILALVYCRCFCIFIGSHVVARVAESLAVFLYRLRKDSNG